MSTYKVAMTWEFVVRSNSQENAKLIVAELTEQSFLHVSKLDEFTYEKMTAVVIDDLEAGVDARL